MKTNKYNETPIGFKADPTLKKALCKIKKGLRSDFIKRVLKDALIKRCPNCNGSGYSTDFNYVNYGLRKDGSIGAMRRKDD